MRSRSPAETVRDADAIGLEHGAEGMPRLAERAGLDLDEVREAAADRVEEIVKRLGPDMPAAFAEHGFQAFAVQLVVAWTDGFILGAQPRE